MKGNVLAIFMLLIAVGLVIKYWWIFLIAAVVFFTVRGLKRRHDRAERERAALIARADAGYRNHLSGGTGLFDENLEMYYPAWRDRQDA